MAEDFPNVRDLFDELENVVDDRGEVLSTASLRLAELRQEIDAAESAVRTAAANFAAREELRRCLQTSEPSWRHGRPVLQVRQEFRHMVEGILHDRSQSGATLFIEPSCVVDLANRFRMPGRPSTGRSRWCSRRSAVGCGRCQAESRRVPGCDREARLGAGEGQAHPCGWLPCGAGGDRRRPASAPGPASHPPAKPAEAASLVPLDITLGEPYRMVVVTGPNTGGKTVVLKTVGLLCPDGPFRGADPCPRGQSDPDLDGVFADIGDAQGISQNLSTFSAHVTRIARCLGRGERALAGPAR